MNKRVEVAAGVIYRGDGTFLLGRRAAGSFYPGYWEFPGGKVEAGEDPAQALVRELREELGIRVLRLNPWVVRTHDYEHARVRLHFFEVSEWEGEVRDHVHDALSWEFPEACRVQPMLPANAPVMKALCLPRFMGITHAEELGVDDQLRRLDAALRDGLRLIQVREPRLEPATLRAFAHLVVAAARCYGARVVINGDAQIASDVGADGVHLRSADLSACAKRPDFEWVGASCHSREELERAAALGFDYVLLGPVKATQTHPGVGGMGWARFGELVHGLGLPVLALGGLSLHDMDDARAAGAHGIATIRSAWP